MWRLYSGLGDVFQCFPRAFGAGGWFEEGRVAAPRQAPPGGIKRGQAWSQNEKARPWSRILSESTPVYQWMSTMF